MVLPSSTVGLVPGCLPPGFTHSLRAGQVYCGGGGGTTTTTTPPTSASSSLPTFDGKSLYERGQLCIDAGRQYGLQPWVTWGNLPEQYRTYDPWQSNKCDCILSGETYDEEIRAERVCFCMYCKPNERTNER